jgi:hypothetical protein
MGMLKEKIHRKEKEDKETIFRIGDRIIPEYRLRRFKESLTLLERMELSPCMPLPRHLGSELTVPRPYVVTAYLRS